ncbi:hypothetical protein GCM10027592_29450 [Spirosoma flavus]
MIWKILTGLLGGLLITGALVYIPDLRFWNKKADKANVELADSLRKVGNKLIVAQNSLAVNAESFARIERDLEREVLSRSAVLPTIKLDVAGLSGLAQRTGILESLVRDKLLKPADTVFKAGDQICYSLPVHEAIAVKLRYSDTLQSRLFYRERAYALVNEGYRLRGDTIQKFRKWSDKGQTLADQKGWFTGRNKKLRKHSRSPPI